MRLIYISMFVAATAAGVSSPPVEIFRYGGGVAPNYRMHQLVIRDNLIRNIDNRSDPNKGTGYGSFAEAIRMEDASLAENALWQKNVIRLDRDDLVDNSMTYRGIRLKTFDNETPGGKLILARDRDLGTIAPELITAIQDAIDDAIIASLVK